MLKESPAFKVWYAPAECYEGCEDRECPYMHKGAWFAGVNGKHLGRGFECEADARHAVINAREATTRAIALALGSDQ